MNSKENLILLVDDDAILGQVLKDYFEINGLLVAYAQDGKTAIQIFNALRPQLILLDVVLPDMDGFEVATQIRKSNSFIPIIFMTGRALERESYNRAYRVLQAANYIEKPIPPQRVLAQIQGLLMPKGAFYFNGLQIKIEQQLLTVNGKEFKMRGKDAQVLSFFC